MGAGALGDARQKLYEYSFRRSDTRVIYQSSRSTFSTKVPALNAQLVAAKARRAHVV